MSYVIIPVAKSTNIGAVEYDRDTETLRIQFLRGDGGTSSTWEYDHVPQDVVTEFANASSAGKFFNSRIKGTFPGQKVG